VFKFLRHLIIRWWKKRNSLPLPGPDVDYKPRPREKLTGLEKAAAQLKAFKETIDRE